MRTFKSLRPGVVKIQDLGISVKYQDTFTVDEDSAATSSNLRSALKAQWLEEVTGKPVAAKPEAPPSSPAPVVTQDVTKPDNLAKVEARVKESGINVQIAERDRQVRIGTMRGLKAYKRENPGVIDTTKPIADQLKQYEDIQAAPPVPTTEATPEADASPELDPNEQPSDEVDSDLSEDEMEISEETDDHLQTPIKESVADGKEIERRQKAKKVRNNTAPKTALPGNWNGMTWQECIAFLKEHADALTERDLESVIDANSPAVTAIARAILLKKKSAKNNG